MTCTDTRDIQATLAQIRALETAGCEAVRVAVLDMDAARVLSEIKNSIHIPLIADMSSDILSKPFAFCFCKIDDSLGKSLMNFIFIKIFFVFRLSLFFISTQKQIEWCIGKK